MIGVHQTTARRTITSVTEALLWLASEWIWLPTRGEVDKGKDKFYQKAAFPDVIDGIHSFTWNMI